MYAYILVFSALWLASSLELFFKVKNSLFFLGFIAIVFLSLRFETGFDWPAYQQVFNVTPPLFDAGLNDIFEVASIESKEPFFVLFVSLLKGFGAEFQALIAVCAIFQISVFVRFLSQLKENSATIFALSISWLLFTLYMSTLRQGLAVSFFLMFMIFMEKKRRNSATFFLAIGLLFQYSSLVYFLMYLVADYVRWNKKLVFLCLILIILALLGVDSSVAVLNLISMAGFEMINSKIDWYVNGYAIPTNAFELFYNIFFSGMTLLILYLTQPSSEDGVLVKKMYGMSLIFCVMGLLFYNFPLLRNRVQYLVLPFCYFFIVRYMVGHRLIYRCLIYTLLFLMHALYFGMFLEKQSSIPFVPYQNYFIHMITGNPGDGAARYDLLE